MKKSDSSNPATKGDFTFFIAEIQKQFSALREEMATKEALESFEAVTKEEFKDIRKEMATKSEFKIFQEEMRVEIRMSNSDMLHQMKILFENFRIDFGGSYDDELSWIKGVQKSHSKRLGRIEEKMSL